MIKCGFVCLVVSESGKLHVIEGSVLKDEARAKIFMPHTFLSLRT
jgi:hypothetical protein